LTGKDDLHIFRYGEIELDHLRKRDAKLGRAIEDIGLIEREVIPDLFTALVASIVSQQISAKAATTVWNRMMDRFGSVTPETLGTASPGEIQQCGVSMRKAGYIKNIGVAVATGELELAGLRNLSDAEVVTRLQEFEGIGVWTAEMLLIFSMERPDVLSWNDLAIRRGMMILYGKTMLEKVLFERLRKRYSPYGSVASLYLWEISHR
jgi:DNA-3-methyladenine glycosylase II